MKTLFVAITLMLSGFCMTQTNVIAAKSHQADSDAYLSESDNFGLPGDWDVIDTVKFIETGCIVEIGRYGRIDTLRSEAYTQQPSDEFLAKYDNTTVFIGFKDIKNRPLKSRNQVKPLFPDRNNLTLFGWIFLILIIGSTIYNLRSVN